MPIFRNKEEYELYKKIDEPNEAIYKAMECRYCNKDVTSYDRGNITVSFNQDCKWGYNGKTLRVCECKGIDPLNKDGKRDWVVYNNWGDVCDVNPYSETMMQRTAEVSGEYRYKLSRIWEPTKDKILFIMINPSTANANEDDRTIKLLLETTKKWETYGGFYVGNLYPHITPRPAELKTLAYPEDIRMKNETSIQEMASECSLIVYAWGTKGPDEKQKEPEWLRKIMNRDVHCLGISVKGVPKHPNQRAPYKNLLSPTPVEYRSNT